MAKKVQTNPENPNSLLFALIGVLAILVVAVFYMQQRKASQSIPVMPTPTGVYVQPVSNSQDLNTLSKQLDQENLNSIDQSLQQNDQDSSGF